MSTPSYVAGEDLSPSLFVKISGDHTVSHSGAGEECVGVTHEGSRTAPVPDAAVLAAKTGESCRVYGFGETCEVTAGAVAITAGAKLKSDANAKAVAATAGDQYYAIARAGAAAGAKCKVQVVRGTIPV